MYTFTNAVCLSRSIGSQWTEVDLSQILVFDIYQNYTKVFLVLYNDVLMQDVFVDFDTLRTEYSSFNDTLEELLIELGSRALTTVDRLPSSNIKFAKYADAFRSRYKAEIGKAGLELPASYPDVEKPDVKLTRPNFNTNMQMVDDNCIVSVNGYYHWTDCHNNILNIYDGAKSLRKSNNNNIGILSFLDIGGLTKSKILESNIFKMDDDTSLKTKLMFSVPAANLENKSYFLVLGGYIVFPQDNVFWQSGLNEFIIELDKLPYVERILESSDYLDLSHLGLTPETINPRAYNVTELTSDTVIKKYFTMSNSFLVVVNCENLVTNKIHLRSSNSPGMFTAYQDPSYPLVVNYGKVAEYWKTYEDGHWSVTVTDSYLRNYVASQQPVREGQTITNNLTGSEAFYHSRGYLLEIAGYTEQVIEDNPQS
jgi:hypothetical protein